MSDTLLKIEDIVKTYVSRASFFMGSKKIVSALSNVSLDIRKGEIFGLVGESGSGKTTTGRLIVGLEEPDSGKIYLDKENVIGLKGKDAKDFRRKVQMIFQDPYQSLNPQFSIFDTISEPLAIHKIGTIPERKEMVEEIMKAVGLSPTDHYIYRFPHQLSGGQRQRVAIARAMVLNPEFVVADEPTSMLDASISAQIFNILLSMRDKYKATLMFITHNLAAARYLCDRIAVVYKGSIMEVGSADEVIENPRHPYTQALIDALPKFGKCTTTANYDTLLKEERPQVFENDPCPFFRRCRIADSVKCFTERPPLTDVGDSHWAACFFSSKDRKKESEGKECF